MVKFESFDDWNELTNKLPGQSVPSTTHTVFSVSGVPSVLPPCLQQSLDLIINFAAVPTPTSLASAVTGCSVASSTLSTSTVSHSTSQASKATSKTSVMNIVGTPSVLQYHTVAHSTPKPQSKVVNVVNVTLVVPTDIDDQPVVTQIPSDLLASIASPSNSPINKPGVVAAIGLTAVIAAGCVAMTVAFVLRRKYQRIAIKNSIEQEDCVRNFEDQLTATDGTKWVYHS